VTKRSASPANFTTTRSPPAGLIQARLSDAQERVAQRQWVEDAGVENRTEGHGVAAYVELGMAIALQGYL